MRPMLLFRSMHEIAAARGDGLHSALLKMMTRPKAWADIESALQSAPADRHIGFPDNDAPPRRLMPFPADER